MSQFSTKIVSDIDLCKELWAKFSPEKSIYDLWDFRFEFWKVFRYEPYFVVLSDAGEDVGLLPLWYVSDKESYFWFGDVGDNNDWQEDNDLWVKNSGYLKPLIDNCPTPVKLFNLTADCFKRAGDSVQFQKHDPKNVLPIDTFGSVEDYLMTLKGKLRGNLTKDRRTIEAQDPVITIDHFQDFDELIRLNILRLEESYFKDPRIGRTFHGIINKGLEKESFQVRMLSAHIDGKPAGFDFILIYDDVYYPLLAAYDIAGFPGIGNYMTLYDIKDAISLGMRMMDFAEGAEDYYKNKLFPMIAQYKIEML